MHQHLFEAFAAWQQGRAFSPKTILRRRTALRSFHRHIAPMPLTSATFEHVEEWLRQYSSPRTRHAYRSDLNCFYTWAVRRQLVDRNPVADTDSIKVPKALPRPIHPHTVMLALACAEDLDLKLMIALAAYAGLRCCEISALTVDDVQLTEVPMLLVRKGKGGKDRIVPVHPDLAALLHRHRGQGRYFPLTPDGIGRRISRHLRALGIDATGHQFRHTFGTQIARLSRGNMILLGRLMGHENPATSLGYAGWDGGEAGTVIAQMYPPAA